MTESINILQLGFVLLVSINGGWGNECPRKCTCQRTTITCAEYYLTIVPNFKNIFNNPKVIDLSGNDIEEIFSINFNSAKLESLHNLYLNENVIWYIDEAAFVSLPNLQRLDLSYNFLEEIPSDMIKENRHMQQLNLSSNNFGGKTPELVSSSLAILDLSLSNITTFTDNNIKGLTNLQVLYLHANYLTHIDISIFANVNMKHISLGYNLWKCNAGTKKLFEYLAKQNIVTDKSMPCFIGYNYRN